MVRLTCLFPSANSAVVLPDLVYGPRQKVEPLYREDTGVACATRAGLVRKGFRIGPNVDIIPSDDCRTSIDIHTPFDFWLAQKVMAEWKEKAS